MSESHFKENAMSSRDMFLVLVSILDCSVWFLSGMVEWNVCPIGIGTSTYISVTICPRGSCDTEEDLLIRLKYELCSLELLGGRDRWMDE